MKLIGSAKTGYKLVSSFDSGNAEKEKKAEAVVPDTEEKNESPKKPTKKKA